MVAKPQLVLVCPPWATPRRPSIALGILSALARELGVPCVSEYLNIDMVTRLGTDVTGVFADDISLYGLSEHLFACSVFNPAELRSDEYLAKVTETLKGE